MGAKGFPADKDFLELQLKKKEWTRKELANEAQVSVQTAERALKGRPISYGNVYNIAKVFGCPMNLVAPTVGITEIPTSSQSTSGISASFIKRDNIKEDSTFMTALQGRWGMFHFTREDRGRIIELPVETQLQINDNGTCEITYGSEGDVRYQGHVEICGNKWFLIKAVSKAQGHDQEVIFRGQLLHRKAQNVYLAWLGVDFPGDLCAGSVLMTKSVRAANEAAKLLARAPIPWAGPFPATNVKQEYLTDNWDENSVIDGIKRMAAGEKAAFCSTFYPRPGFSRIVSAIEALCENLETQRAKNRTAITLLYFDPRESAVSKARFSLLRNKPPSFLSEVIEQLKLLQDLKRKVRRRVVVNIKIFKTWPFGHYFRINHTVYYSPLLADDTAVNSPMFVCSDKTSELWRRLVNNFDITEVKARPLRKADISEWKRLHAVEEK